MKEKINLYQAILKKGRNITKNEFDLMYLLLNDVDVKNHLEKQIEL